MDTEAKFDHLVDMSRRLLADIIKLHGEVHAMSMAGRLPATQDHLSELFRSSVAADAPRQLEADVSIVPGVVCSFERDTGCVAELARAANEGESGLNSLELSLSDPGKSRWFTVEVSMPWVEVRPARDMEWTMSASSSKLLNCRAMVRATDTDGKHHKLGGANFMLPDHPGVVGSGFPLILPHTVRFDEFNPPKFIIFFELVSFKVVIEHIHVSLR